MNNTGKTILSILIPTIPSRRDLLHKLEVQLTRQRLDLEQFPMLGNVEIIVNSEHAFLDGGPSIGKKRERLVASARGKYLCFLDDDDTISPNYLEALLRMCNQNLDVCTFRAMVKLQTYWALVDMRLLYKVNDQLTPEYTVRRPPWHMCPVRTQYAQMYPFQDINNAEDFEWFEKVLSHCTSEAHTDKILFQYNHGAHSEADKIERHVQSES